MFIEKRIAHTHPKQSSKVYLFVPKKIWYDLGFSVDDFKLMFPKSQGSLQELLTPSSELINKTEPKTKGFASKDIFKLPQETLVKTAINNYNKNLTINFLYDKSNFIKETSVTEISKIVSIYSSVSYFG